MTHRRSKLRSNIPVHEPLHFGDRVVVVDGFYKGCRGIVFALYEPKVTPLLPYYTVEVKRNGLTAELRVASSALRRVR